MLVEGAGKGSDCLLYRRHSLDRRGRPQTRCAMEYSKDGQCPRVRPVRDGELGYGAFKTCFDPRGVYAIKLRESCIATQDLGPIYAAF